MIFGIKKPKICLIDGATEAEKELSLSFAPNKLEPKFIPDLVKAQAQDGTLAIFSRGHFVEIDAYFPYISDADFRTLLDILKHQFDFDANNDYAQYCVSIEPHYGDSDELYYGYITTPLHIINEFHFLNHGLKFKFEGRSRLAQNQFLVTS